MSFFLRICHPDGHREARELAGEGFWIGAGEGDFELGLPIPGLRGPLVELRRSAAGVEVRALPGIPIEVRTLAGRVGSRFVPLLDGDLLSVGACEVAVEPRPDDASPSALDAASLGRGLTLGEGDAGALDLSGWFESFMALADRLDGVRDLEELARLTLEAMLATTVADRCYVEADREQGTGEWFLSRVGGAEAFGVSRSLIARVRNEKGVVFVPESSSDPLVAGLLSVRREGISSSLAVPLRALGRSVGVLYADCVEPGHSLGTADFQKAALLGRMFASALGTRSLVRRVLGGDPELPAVLESRSPACRDMVERARLYAPTDYTILVRGETGSGKEVLARAIHAMSERAKGPFVAVNCAAIPEQLMECELFGHVKGSFTGANADRTGFFVAASGGTLFLDEIGDMGIELQAKILRALETRVVTPLGGTSSVAVDVRIMAATHRSLEAMVEGAEFREDLYYRLRELEIRIPPLRERPEDLLPLAEGFLAEAVVELPGAGEARITPEAVRLLMEHPWRGNVRELRHATRTALLRAAGGAIGPEHFELRAPGLFYDAGGSPSDAETAGEVEPGSWRERLERQEREALRRTYEESGGNLTRAAQVFGLPRTTYRERLLRHGILPQP